MPTPPSVTGPIDTESLKRYLASKSIQPTSITPLTGGTANFVFRILTHDGTSQIIKHAEPYIAASYGNIPFPLERMDFEATALNEIGALMQQNAIVKVPRTLDYDREAKVLTMTDGGKTTLKDAYARTDLDMPAIGREMGLWLAALHHSTKRTGIGEGGNPIGKSVYRWAYAHLAEVAERYGLDVGFAEWIDEKYGALLAADDECVCQGDFWPGNVLLDEEKSLTVVDWEMCRRGCGATDVGQFAAETYLLDRLRGGKGLQQAFLRGYREAVGKFGGRSLQHEGYLKRVAVHMGVHLAYWPASVKWADEDETKAVIELGHELMRHGDAGDMEWLADHLLAGLFG
ncbi:MAG: hypothetical protein LQ338_005767 [Usnochroma carphineum]|nr:MAG: hypothetical protein LQ338_005767 [Usnochroma carphineum]